MGVCCVHGVWVWCGALCVVCSGCGSVCVWCGLCVGVVYVWVVCFVYFLSGV